MRPDTTAPRASDLVAGGLRGTRFRTRDLAPLDEERPHSPNPTSEERDAQSSRMSATQETSLDSEDRSAVPCSLEPWELEEAELGAKAAQCLGTENDLGYFMAKVAITARAIKAGYFATVRP